MLCMGGPPPVHPLCPVYGCGRRLDKCSGRPRSLPPDFTLQLDSSIDAVVNSHVCAACYARHTRRLARGPEHTPSSYAAPHLDALVTVAIGQPRESSSPPSSPPPPLPPSLPPAPSSWTSSPTSLLSTPPPPPSPLSLTSSLPAARRALALLQTTLHNINPACPPCPTASTPDHAHHISGPRSSLLSSHYPQPQHEVRTSDASDSDALRLYFGCRPVVPRLYRGCGRLHPTTRWLRHTTEWL